jgi:hypothetical protein
MDILLIKKNIFIIKKINNMNISNTISKIIKWYHTLEKKILYMIIWKKNSINNEDVVSTEKII